MIRRILAILTSGLVGLILAAGPAVADTTPDHSVVRYCIPNRITVAEITLSGYPEGSTFFIEDFQNEVVNGTTTTYLTVPITIRVDSSDGDIGDFTQVIKPKPQCRLPRWR